MLATEWGMTSVVWAMIAFIFWVAAICVFIAVFADIFRRRDLSGWTKAAWIVLIFFVPILGSLIYLIVRPSVVDDREGAESYARPALSPQELAPRYN